jgi:multidrug efflux pump subunit AcrA (membrane-fusion protein)
VSAGVSRQVTLTPAEQVAQSDGFLSKMETARGNVRRQLETARTQRDVVKTLCLNDKLNQLDVAIRSARERQAALQAAASRSDVDLSNHEFTILSVLNQRSDQLMSEANQCIGQEAGFVGESSITSTIDPGLPNEDPSEYPNNNVVIEPPACSSCIK